MRDFFVEDTDKDRISFLAYGDRDIVGKDDIAVRIQIVVVAQMDVSLYCDGFCKSDIGLAAIDGKHALLYGVIIAQLLRRIHGFDVFMGVEMAARTSDNRCRRQFLILAQDGDIVDGQIGERNIGVMLMGPVVVRVEVGHHSDITIGQLLHHASMVAIGQDFNADTEV